MIISYTGHCERPYTRDAKRFELQKKRPKPLKSPRRAQKLQRALKHPHPGLRRFLCCQPIAKRQPEGLGFDLEYVALLRLHPVAERQSRGAKEVDMNVARAAEQAVFEMMRLEIGDRMRHVLLARQKRLFPDDFLAPPDAGHAVDVRGQIADQQFRANACGPEFRMREPKIVLPLGDVVGELVAQREPDTERRAGVIDKIDANDLRLFAAVKRESGAGQVALGSGEG